MTAINKVVAYSISSFWLTLLIVVGVDYSLLLEPIFWTITIALALPVGMLFEPWYSMFYRGLSKLGDKFKFLNFAHLIAYRWYDSYKKNYQNFGNSFYSDPSFQSLLSEINISRNMWISSLLGLIILIIYFFVGQTNTIIETKIFIWLPLAIPFMWGSNLRTEVLIKKRKSIIYETNIIKEIK